MNSTMINEGMRKGDLSGTILPIISADEYVSKIDDNAIVFGFYVNDMYAARDLNRFIQKSSVDILDTEISPAPDQHGYFLVFVEIYNNRQIGNAIWQLAEEISSLSNIDEWQIRFRGDSVIHDLKSGIVVAKHFDHDIQESVSSFLTNSALSNLTFEDNTIILEGNRQAVSFSFVDFGNENDVLVNNNLLESPFSMTASDINKSSQLVTMLGSGWQVGKIGDAWAFHNQSSDNVLLVK